MAYVPDEMMRRKRNVSRSAWDVYEALCAFADSDTGIVEPYHFNYPKLVEMSGVKLGTARNAMTELRQKGWRWEDEAGRIHLIGIFVIEAKRQAEERKRKAKKALPASAQPSLLNDDVSLPSDTTSLGNDAASSASDAHIDKDRARGFTNPDQPATSPHTPTQGAAGRDGMAAGAGGCVPISNSRQSRADCVAWAEWRKAEGGRIDDAYAVGIARWRDGTADDEIADFLARREQVLEGRRPVEQQFTPYHVAAQAVASVAQVPGYDVAAYIAQMQGVSEETREKLRERFLQSPAGDIAKRAGAGK